MNLFFDRDYNLRRIGNKVKEDCGLILDCKTPSGTYRVYSELPRDACERYAYGLFGLEHRLSPIDLGEFFCEFTIVYYNYPQCYGISGIGLRKG